MSAALILKRASASRPSGQWRDDDYEEDGVPPKPGPLRSFFPGASLFPGAQGNISRRTRHLSPRAVACRPCNGSVDEGGRRHLSRAPPCSPTRSRGRQTQSDRSQPLCPPGQLPLPNARRDQRLKRKPRKAVAYGRRPFFGAPPERPLSAGLWPATQEGCERVDASFTILP